MSILFLRNISIYSIFSVLITSGLHYSYGDNRQLDEGEKNNSVFSISLVEKKDFAPLEDIHLKILAEEKARSIFIEQFTKYPNAQPILVEGIRQGKFLITLEEVHSPLIDKIFTKFTVVKATLQRRSPNDCLIALDDKQETYELPKDFTQLIRKLDIPLDERNLVIEFACLYVSLSTHSELTVFPLKWEDIPWLPKSPPPNSVSPKQYDSRIQPFFVEKLTDSWNVTLVSWEKSLGRLTQWNISLNRKSKKIISKTEEIGQRVGDFIMDRFY